ncbi:MAG TPA: type 4a pilus biogenesis protein PilO [Solirubrobacterales bacterium]|nr:type 4a pilus biogenesis protein PilO [Solirubrobacterales bacterium]
MKLSTHNQTIIAIIALVGLAIAFWALVLSPKREEASKLSTQADQLRASVAESQRQVEEAEAAKREFPTDYQRLVVLGQAVPDNEETSSLLVEVSRVARQADVRFESIELESEGSGEAPEISPSTTPPGAEGSAGVPASNTVPPTEAAASLLPLGASIGPAGLGVMPYKLAFSGSFFQMADFIAGIDKLVGGGEETVAVDGRLITIDGFTLKEETGRGFPHLEADFAVTTYLTPPENAASTEPAPLEATPSTAPAGGPETAEPSTPAELASQTTPTEAR